MPVDARLRCVPLLLATLVATACGSTVQVTSQTTDGLSAGGGAGLGGSTLSVPQGSAVSGGGAAQPGTTGAGAVSGGGGTTGVPSAGAGSSPAGGGGTTVAAQGVGRSGPGVTDRAIYVGLVYDQNAGAVNEAAGVGAITSGDSKQNATAIIDDINKHGGVAGRKLVPVYAQFDSTSTQTLESQWASVCQKFTQDSPRVFAVLGAGTAAYRSCVSKAGVVILSDDLPTVGAAEFRRFPGLIEQGYANLDRLAAYQVTSLAEQRYFTPWDAVRNRPAQTGAVKVGIYTYNDPYFSHAVDTYLVPGLKKLGYDPVVAKITQVATAADYSSQAAAVKSAQLDFAARGVTHVIPFESNGGMSVFFLANAKSQRYFPRYGINSASGFQALMDAGVADGDQVKGAVGFGWIPVLDMPQNLNPDNGPYSNASRRHCLKVMQEHGITFDSSNAKGIAISQCSALYLLQLVAGRTPAEINLPAFMRTVEGLGSTYLSGNSLGQEFRPGRHDPANRAYHWRYFADCDCFHYEGAKQTIP